MVLSSRQQSAMCSICPVRIVLDDRQIICKERFIPVYRLDEDGDLLKEGDGMLLVWALRARSYKTKAEA